MTDDDKKKKKQSKSKDKKNSKGKTKNGHSKGVKHTKAKKHGGKKSKSKTNKHNKNAHAAPLPAENLGDVVLVKHSKGGKGSAGRHPKVGRSKVPSHPAAGDRPPYRLPTEPPRKAVKMNLSAESTAPPPQQQQQLPTGPNIVDMQYLPSGPADFTPTPVPEALLPCRPQEPPLQTLAAMAADYPMESTTTAAPPKEDLFGTETTPTPNGEKKEERNAGKNSAVCSSSTIDKEKQEPKSVCDDEITKKGTPPKGASGPYDGLSKWRKYIERLIDGGNDGINAEFRTVHSHMPSCATRIGFDANMHKNRFEDVVCVDHTRVPLQDNAYIHASWVNVGKGKKAILTQLPLLETACDFWQMVLEQNVQAVLLLLSPFEYNTFNADATFPGEKDFLHFSERHIRVGEFKRVKINSRWTMHVYAINDGDRKRYVHMHHYTGWQHGLAPKTTVEMWQIQSALRRYSPDVPPVYMSLSGCGRAGTWAVFEAAHHQLHNECVSRVNVGDCVSRIRSGRMHALQRPCQLKAVHMALAEHVLNNGLTSQLNEKQRERMQEMIRSPIK